MISKALKSTALRDSQNVGTFNHDQKKIETWKRYCKVRLTVVVVLQYSDNL